MLNFPILDGDVPRRAAHGVYISQLIRFTASKGLYIYILYVTYFNTRNRCLTAKLLCQTWSEPRLLVFSRTGLVIRSISGLCVVSYLRYILFEGRCQRTSDGGNGSHNV